MRHLGFQEIVPGIYQLGGFWGSGVLGANVFLLAGDRLTLVDTGFKGRLKGIIDSVKQLGYSALDIGRIIVTHHHADHTGNLADLKKLTNAEVIAHTADVPYIDGTLPQPGLQRPVWLSRYLASFDWSWAYKPVKVDLIVNDGDELPVLTGVKIIHSPGHTPGSICLWLRNKGVLIVGDVLAHRFGLRLPALSFTVDIAEEIRSVNKIAQLDFEIVCFGHGTPIKERAQETVAKFAAKIAKRYL
jgi:glyoxylase-like metal-dependent hydrolase (beta-lactamase superfamily II)